MQQCHSWTNRLDSRLYLLVANDTEQLHTPANTGAIVIVQTVAPDSATGDDGWVTSAVQLDWPQTVTVPSINAAVPMFAIR